MFLGLGRTKKVCVANATVLNAPVSEVTQFLSDDEMFAVGLTVACDDFEKMQVFLMVNLSWLDIGFNLWSCRAHGQTVTSGIGPQVPWYLERSSLVSTDLW